MNARDVLHAWVCGDYVGRFERNTDVEKPRFVYDAGSKRLLSLSLPRERTHGPTAAGRFLDALLPERESTKERIRTLAGARSTDTWELLEAIGGDLPGGIVMHIDASGLQRGEPFTRVASAGTVSARISDIKAGGTGFDGAGEAPPRFSLAGAQGKFALCEVDGALYWPDAASPSTHILKPEAPQHRGLETIEVATLELARRAGIDAPAAYQQEFAGETTFVIERFDRARDTEGVPIRLHAEDLTQALGRPVAEKYQVHTDDVVQLLREHTGDDELGYAFYRHYAFNAIIGNSDAHAKNYTILHGAKGLKLSPLYDAIPIGMFPDYSQSLAMPVGFMDHYRTATRGDWIESAANAGLDPDRVLSIVEQVATGVLEHLDTTLGALDAPRDTAAVVSDIRGVAEGLLTR